MYFGQRQSITSIDRSYYAFEKYASPVVEARGLDN